MGHDEDNRECPRCKAELVANARRGESGVVLLWKCACGWAGARTISLEDEHLRRRTASGVAERVILEPTDVLDVERKSARERQG
jgi:hypothetical protein